MSDSREIKLTPPEEAKLLETFHEPRKEALLILLFFNIPLLLFLQLIAFNFGNFWDGLTSFHPRFYNGFIIVTLISVILSFCGFFLTRNMFFNNSFIEVYDTGIFSYKIGHIPYTIIQDIKITSAPVLSVSSVSNIPLLTKFFSKVVYQLKLEHPTNRSETFNDFPFRYKKHYDFLSGNDEIKFTRLTTFLFEGKLKNNAGELKSLNEQEERLKIGDDG